MIHAFLRTTYHRAGGARQFFSGIVLTLFFSCVAGRLTAQQALPLTFIAIGDGGESGTTLNGNAAAMRQWATTLQQQGTPVGLLLFLGDNFYPIGLNQPEPKRRELIESV